MSGVHDCSEMFLPVEDGEGLWIVVTHDHDTPFQLFIGPFPNALEAGEWARQHAADGLWGVTPLLSPEHWPGGATPPPPDDELQGEFDYEQTPDNGPVV